MGKAHFELLFLRLINLGPVVKLNWIRSMKRLEILSVKFLGSKACGGGSTYLVYDFLSLSFQYQYLRRKGHKLNKVLNRPLWDAGWLRTIGSLYRSFKGDNSYHICVDSNNSVNCELTQRFTSFNANVIIKKLEIYNTF